MATHPHDDPPAPRPGPDVEHGIARIRAEYVAADHLLILLAGHAARRDPVAGWDHLTADQQAATIAAMTQAAARVLRWRPLPVLGPMAEPASRASFTVTDAVAAVDLRETAADAAAHLTAGWATATRVHNEIHQMGPGAETIAARLLTGWHHPLPLLPTVLRELLAQPPHPP